MNAQIVLSELSRLYVRKNGLKICKLKAKLQIYKSKRIWHLDIGLGHKAKEKTDNFVYTKIQTLFACHVTDKGSI